MKDKMKKSTETKTRPVKTIKTKMKKTKRLTTKMKTVKITKKTKSNKQANWKKLHPHKSLMRCLCF